jgi:MFS family permease
MHLENDNEATFENRNFSTMTAEDRATALKLAHEADPGPALFSYRFLCFIATCFVVIVNSCDTGFDTTIMSSVNSMVTFQSYFGLKSATVGTGILFVSFLSIQGVWNDADLNRVFTPLEVSPHSFLTLSCPILSGGSTLWHTETLYSCESDLYILSILLIYSIGAIISANSRSFPMLLGGRWLTGFGCSTAALSAKTYLAEITSPKSRGRYMGVLNSFYYGKFFRFLSPTKSDFAVGQILATGVAIPLGRLTTDASWRTCLYLQCAPAVINVAFILFICESPRWLYARGRKEEAIAVLARYHSATGDVNSPLIRLQVMEIEEGISVDGGDRRFWDFRCLFNSRSNRYRFGLCAMISCWGQLAGNGMITCKFRDQSQSGADEVDFLPVLLEQAGIISRDRQRQLNLVNSCTSMIGALTGSAIVDHVGRRKLLLTGIACAATGMCIVGFLLSPLGVETTTRANAGISFICETPEVYMRHKLKPSPIHGHLLLRVDAPSRSLPRRSSDVRKSCKRSFPSRLGNEFVLSHQHFWSPTSFRKAQIHQ